MLQQVAKIVETLDLLGALLISGRGSGKGLNSRYGGHLKLGEMFFNESVSTILQLVVASAQQAAFSFSAIRVRNINLLVRSTRIPHLCFVQLAYTCNRKNRSQMHDRLREQYIGVIDQA